jgi:hypothetical protein
MPVVLMMVMIMIANRVIITTIDITTTYTFILTLFFA